MVDKKKKRKKQRIQKKIVTKQEASPYYDTKFDLDGVIRIILSKMSRRAIGCVLGEHFTAEDPWLFIKKEAILDNLELHEESSQFLPIKDAIINYPHDEILIGFNRPLAGEDQEFLICIQVKAKNKVLQIIETEKIELQERIKESINKTPGVWCSQGSEEEVDENIIQNTRPLIEIEVVFMFPLSSETKKFSFRFVKDAVDGYVEILPGRDPVRNVQRRRVDSAIQKTPTYKDNESQTICSYPKNMWTQYEYIYDTPKLNKEQMKSLENFIKDQEDYMSEALFLNYKFDLYINDYKKISKPVSIYKKHINNEVISFRDVTLCKHKLVTDLELDPFISGLFAVSYGRLSRNSVYTDETIFKDINDIVFESNVVLIWCNSRSSVPKLILRSDREINCIKYCPYRRDILLGGCSNGQIVIWDLEDRLENVENIEIITRAQRHNRQLLKRWMKWMKKPEGISVVLPTAVSDINFSHGETVMQMGWVLPNFQFTKNGKLIKQEDSELDSMQFMSIGNNGTILIWDLLDRPGELNLCKSRKSTRLSSVPEALTKNVSEFKVLNRKLTPIFKVILKENDTNFPIPLSQFVIKNIQYTFKPLIPDPEENLFLRTYYQRGPINPSYIFSEKFVAVDNLGKFYYCYFEGHDYDQGLRVNKAKCKYEEYPIVHDGPIRTCVANRKNEDIILTVGGKVFAVWDMNNIYSPIIWRKSFYRYIFGCWSRTSSNLIITQRTDSYLEIWDFISRNKIPVRIMHLNGCTILDTYCDQQRQHCNKRSFHVSDVIGGVRIYKIPPKKGLKSEDSEMAQNNMFRKRQQIRREYYAKWLEEWTKKHISILDPETEQETEKVQKIEVEKVEKNEEQNKENIGIQVKLQCTPSEKWIEKQHKYMLERILQRKKLNLAEIQQNNIILQKVLREKKHKYKKQRNMLENKENIFNASLTKIFKEELIHKDKYTVKLPEDIVTAMKETYVDYYKDIIEESLNEIENCDYSFVFIWSKFMNNGKEIRKSLAPASYCADIRYSVRDSLRQSRMDSLKENTLKRKSNTSRKSSKKLRMTKPSVMAQLEIDRRTIASMHVLSPPPMRRRITPKSLENIPL